jgi:hypothetical protein
LLLSDEPISDATNDHFGFAAFANALAGIIDNEKTATPLTIAVSAPWGAGKTSVAKMLVRRLGERVAARGGRSKRITCWFNAWEHADAPHLGAALAAQVARTANAHRPRWRRLLQPLPEAMLEPRERWLRLLGFALAGIFLAALITVVEPSRDLAEQALHLDEAVISGLGVLGFLWLVALVWGFVYRAARNAARFVDEPGSEAARGSMAQVKAQLGELIEQATRGGRMVIFVDDLERCRPERAVQVFEVASQLLAHRGVVAVLLADMSSLSVAAATAYSAEDRDDGVGVGRRYLEKLVQLELSLPPPTPTDMKHLLANRRPTTTPTEEEGAEGEEATMSDNSGPERSWLGYGDIARLNGGGALGFVVGIPLCIASIVAGADIFHAMTILAGTITLGLWLGLVVGIIRMAVGRTRRSRVERRVVQTVESDPELVELEGEEADALVARLAQDEDYEQLVRQTIDGLKTVRSEDVMAVEAMIRSHPPRFPRGAKRMLNHARLLTKIARERRMFGGDPLLTPEHLGKWIAISERWPKFADRISRQPALLGSFEQPTHNAPLPGEWPRDDSGDLDLDFKALLEADPPLAGVIGRLVYFVPAETSAPGDEA